jgi:hypothetical protein
MIPRRSNVNFVNQAPSPTSGSNLQQDENSKLLLIFLGVFSVIVFIVIIVVLVFILGSNKTISNADLVVGASLFIEEGDTFKFSLGNDDHKITLDSFDSDSADVTIQSNPISVNLILDENTKVDLDDDGRYDLLLRLDSLGDEDIEVYMKKISESVCDVDWVCEDWSACVNGTKTRVCEDLESCGDDEDKPDEEKACVVSLGNCSSFSGVICNATLNETCVGSILNSSDSGVCCDGTCEVPLGNCSSLGGSVCNISLLEVCEGSILSASDTTKCCDDCQVLVLTPIGCGDDIDCMISNAAVCNVSEVIFNFSIDLFGWVQNHSYKYLINGFDSNNNCTISTEILDVFGNYSSDLWISKNTIEDGDGNVMTLDEIQADVDEINTALSSVIGDTNSCVGSVTHTVEFFELLKAEDFMGESDMECTDFS